jgi:hypothetical protein
MTYTELDLRKLRGQAIKDIWHSLIGKGPGIRNTTGLKTSDEIIQAILQGQENPEFLKQFMTKALKHKADESIELEEMPPKQKPGPKPKVKTPQQTCSTAACSSTRPAVVAVESTEPPITNTEVNRIKVHKLYVDNTLYFLDAEKNNVYSKPGVLYGHWNAETKTLSALE